MKEHTQEHTSLCRGSSSFTQLLYSFWVRGAVNVQAQGNTHTNTHTHSGKGIVYHCEFPRNGNRVPWYQQIHHGHALTLSLVFFLSLSHSLSFTLSSSSLSHSLLLFPSLPLHCLLLLLSLSPSHLCFPLRERRRALNWQCCSTRRQVLHLHIKVCEFYGRPLTLVCYLHAVMVR